MPLNPTTNREIHDFILMKYRYTDADDEGAEYRVAAGYYSQLFDIYEAGIVTDDEELEHMLANRRWEIETYTYERGWTLDRDYPYPEKSTENRFNLVSAPKSAYTADQWRQSFPAP
jgi:hypothetical protein